MKCFQVERNWLVLYLMVFLGQGCSLPDNPDKNRCRNDGDCLHRNICVAGRCLDKADVGVGSSSAGLSHTCIVRQDGTLWCWGNNQYGQLALSDGPVVDKPTKVGLVSNWRSVTSGDEHSCGIRGDGSLWCWGHNLAGQLGTGGTNSATVPVPVGTLRDWVMVAAGSEHTCAVRYEGGLYCWGSNQQGQLGNSTQSFSLQPERVGTPGKEKQWRWVSADGNSSCAITAAGDLICWGEKKEPTQLGKGQRWSSVSSAPAYDCAVGNDGAILWCWGNHVAALFGQSPSDDPAQPVKVQGSHWVQVSCGFDHLCAISGEQGLTCWGLNPFGQLGQGQPTPKAAVGNPKSATTWQRVAAGGGHTCAWGQDSSVWCWGDNRQGQSGQTGGRNQAEPVAIGTKQWQMVAAGGSRTCAVAELDGGENSLWCWGTQQSEGLSDNEAGSWIASDAPTHISTLTGVRMLNLSSGLLRSPVHGCAATSWANVNSLLCWGDNRLGQLGLGDQSASYLATPVVVTQEWLPTALGMGSTHTCASSQGLFVQQLFCTGGNEVGQLGLGNTQATSSLTSIDGKWEQVGAGFAHTCAIHLVPVIDLLVSKIYCWGSNAKGQLGHGNIDTNAHPTPAAIESTITDWAGGIRGGGYHTCSDTKSGQLYCWGNGSSGQLGTGVYEEVGLPSRVQGVQSWSFGPYNQLIALGEAHTCGVDAGKSLWCWGSNSHGQLGHAQSVGNNEPLPVQVGESGVWSVVTAGARHTCAIKTDQTLWCWGSNEDGQLGTGTGWLEEPNLVLSP